MNGVDSVKLLELNFGKKFNPADLKSKNKNIRDTAVKVILEATKILNDMCDESLKSNILHGIRKQEDKNASLSNNAFRLNKKSMSYIKRGKDLIDIENSHIKKKKILLMKKKKYNFF